MLERMIEADDFTAAVKRGEGGARRRAESGRRRSAQDVGGERRAQGRRGADGRRAGRHSSRPSTSSLLAIFEGVAQKRNGIAVAEARDGICSICHVRLRPQVFNTVLRNEQILQCDYCNRILYHTPKTAAAAADPLRQPAQ